MVFPLEIVYGRACGDSSFLSVRVPPAQDNVSLRRGRDHGFLRRLSARAVQAMIREHIFREKQGEANFRWRSDGVSRVEGLSDAAFAFALTLLVVANEVPRTYGQLMDAMRRMPAFAACFAILIMCWFLHCQFFRRFGLHDTTTVLLNAVLLFIILFYVYPMKFVFTMLIGPLFGLKEAANLLGSNVPHLMVVYGIGFIGVFVLFATLYRHAYRQRQQLELDEVETYITRVSIHAYLLTASVGGLSVLLALVAIALGSVLLSICSGLVYNLLFVVHIVYARRVARHLESLKSAGSDA